MNVTYDKDTKKPATGGKTPGNNGSSLVPLLLCLLVGVLAYAYFFTDIITQNTVTQTADNNTATAPVKQALPPRSSATVAATVAQPHESAAEKTSPVVSKRVETPPAPASPTAVSEEKKSALPVTAVPLVVNKKRAKQSPRLVSSPAPVTGLWLVHTEGYTVPEHLATDLSRIKRAGLSPLVETASHQKQTMNRLFLGEYQNREAAESAFTKLRQHTNDAFVLKQNGNHAVYAGSYQVAARAISEKGRLAAAGYSLDIKKAEIPLASKSIRIGVFSSLTSAQKVVKQLEDMGIPAAIAKKKH